MINEQVFLSKIYANLQVGVKKDFHQFSVLRVFDFIIVIPVIENPYVGSFITICDFRLVHFPC